MSNIIISMAKNRHSGPAFGSMLLEKYGVRKPDSIFFSSLLKKIKKSTKLNDLWVKKLTVSFDCGNGFHIDDYVFENNVIKSAKISVVDADADIEHCLRQLFNKLVRDVHSDVLNSDVIESNIDKHRTNLTFYDEQLFYKDVYRFTETITDDEFYSFIIDHIYFFNIYELRARLVNSIRYYQKSHKFDWFYFCMDNCRKLFNTLFKSCSFEKEFMEKHLDDLKEIYGKQLDYKSFNAICNSFIERLNNNYFYKLDKFLAENA